MKKLSTFLSMSMSLTSSLLFSVLVLASVNVHAEPPAMKIFFTIYGINGTVNSNGSLSVRGDLRYATWGYQTEFGVSKEFPEKPLYTSFEYHGGSIIYENIWLSFHPVNRGSSRDEDRTVIPWMPGRSGEIRISSDKETAIITVKTPKDGNWVLLYPIGKYIRSLDTYAKSLPFFDAKIYGSRFPEIIHLYDSSKLKDSTGPLDKDIVWSRVPGGLYVSDYKNGYMRLSKDMKEGGTYYLVDGWRGGSTVTHHKYIAKPYQSKLAGVFEFWPTYTSEQWEKISTGKNASCQLLF